MGQQIDYQEVFSTLVCDTPVPYYDMGISCGLPNEMGDVPPEMMLVPGFLTMGGNSHKNDRYYADRHVAKPEKPNAHHSTTTLHDKPATHNTKPAANSNKPTREIAKNTTNTNRSGSGHFGRR